MLFEGKLNADWNGSKKEVYIKIFNDLTCRTSFAHQSGNISFRFSFEDYRTLATFMMMREDVPVGTFNTMRRTSDAAGIEKIETTMSTVQIINIIKYSVIEVFRCANDIIRQSKRAGTGVQDYCIFHIHDGRRSTYEESIHLHTCHCLWESMYISTDTMGKYPPSPVDYVFDDNTFKLGHLSDESP
jgi:hypothetical protein